MEDQHYTVRSKNSLSVVWSRANFEVIFVMQSSSLYTKTREKNQVTPAIRSFCSQILVMILNIFRYIILAIVTNF